MTNITIENINTVKALGIAIKRMRKNRGLSQTELGELTGMRQATISDLENGKGTLDSLFKAVQILKINMTCTNQKSSSKKASKTRVQKVVDLLNE